MNWRFVLLAVSSLLLHGCIGAPEMPDNVQVKPAAPSEFTVIAHRGASGYLPEHTLAGVATAHGMGADFIEMDVVSTRDGELVVLHDLYLDAVTDVADRFPGRERSDGRFYAIDFKLDEIRALRVHERLGADGSPTFPGRFPAGIAVFRLATLQESIGLIQSLNETTGREVGVYVEPKSPAWHRGEGKDLMAAVIGELEAFGYAGRDDRAFLQSFDLDALKRARRELGSELKLVQLIGENRWRESPSDFDYLLSETGLAEIAAFADGIGPWLPQVVHISGPKAGQPTGLVAAAHAQGLLVHAYTLRADQLPQAIGSIAAAMDILVGRVGLDGVFTDHADQVIRYFK